MARIAGVSRGISAHPGPLGAPGASRDWSFERWKEMGGVYMLLMVRVHRRRRIEGLAARGHDSLLHRRSALAGQGVSSDGAGPRGLVREGRTSSASLVH